MSKRKLRLSLYSERRLGPLSGRIFWVAGTLGLKPRLRKAYVAAKLIDYAGRQTRARRSVAKEA